MKKVLAPLVTIFLGCFASVVVAESESVSESKLGAFSSDIDEKSILKVTNAVADWQLAHPYEKPDWDWTEAALWTGFMAHCHTTGSEKYFDAMQKVSEGIQYKLGPRLGFGDDHCVGQLHLWHYFRDGMPEQLTPTREVMKSFVDRPHTESLKWKKKIQLREWAWCDSLYMAPPTLAMLYAATGDRQFIDVMDQLWWKTTDYLYVKDSALYWRDSKYFKSREANGEKVFWSRGNGWVFAGLCHVLQYMPADYPSRKRYIKLFHEMAAKLKDIQLEDGSWHASLLDPDSFDAPETSGTAFFTYGFLWGINNGILSEKEYLPAAIKGWKRLVKNVHPDGKLGYIQPIGEDPRKVTFDQTAVYGVGGFLQCAHELLKHLILADAKTSKIEVSNPLDAIRLNEVVYLDWSLVQKKLPSATSKNVGVRDLVSGYFLEVQVVDDNEDGQPDGLLFQTHMTPSENRSFELCAFGEIKPHFRDSQLMARFVPERKDDFAWENDRIAFRVYGPALAVEDARGGIDVWTKSVRSPIVDQWYKKGDAYYHKDNGTGLDGYKVGASLGCGGLGYLTPQGVLVTSPVFKKSRVIESGPLRLKFELSYDPVQVGDTKVSETRVITMVSGQHHFSVQSNFKVDGEASKVRPVAGLVTRSDQPTSRVSSNYYIGYWDDIMAKKNGYIGTYILTEDAVKGEVIYTDGHWLKVLASDLTKPVYYEAGAIWQKVDVPDLAGFEKILSEEQEKFLHPVTIK